MIGPCAQDLRVIPAVHHVILAVHGIKRVKFFKRLFVRHLFPFTILSISLSQAVAGVYQRAPGALAALTAHRQGESRSGAK